MTLKQRHSCHGRPARAGGTAVEQCGNPRFSDVPVNPHGRDAHDMVEGKFRSFLVPAREPNRVLVRATKATVSR
ncbi:MAG: hypothetical protein AVDCRST_MAG64-4254 [uncultured Phycisphaerae bacterium]|uniref:Uncharacterized protein n=1 Tax=uncultured Phycisphaerae bacterium TaxID=904963 RepID=A0A6J4QHB5_9BACT|nr:MAG: hypothetical protein AVDCRST_MAG64-4254 [uncultured Phycisphaerae bacterium]